MESESISLTRFLGEGQAERSTNSPTEVNLPDDEWWAIAWICNRLHLKELPDEDKRIPNSEKLLKLSMSVDKYDLTNVLRMQMQSFLMRWIIDCRKDCDILDTSDVIAASYLLHQSRAFQMATQVFVERRFRKPSQLLQQQSGKLYPTSVLRKSCLRIHTS